MKNEMYERIMTIAEDDEIGRISRERIRNMRNRKRKKVDGIRMNNFQSVEV